MTVIVPGVILYFSSTTTAAQSCQGWTDCAQHLVWGSDPTQFQLEDFMSQREISISEPSSDGGSTTSTSWNSNKNNCMRSNSNPFEVVNSDCDLELATVCQIQCLSSDEESSNITNSKSHCTVHRRLEIRKNYYMCQFSIKKNQNSIQNSVQYKKVVLQLSLIHI